MLCNLGGPNLRPLIIIGETYYVTESIGCAFRNELSCSVHIFKDVYSWKRSPYVQCLAFIVVDASASLGLYSCHEVVSQLRDLGNGAPIIVISDVDTPANIENSIRHGASGYISTSTTLREALEAVRFVLSDGIFVPGGTALLGHC